MAWLSQKIRRNSFLFAVGLTLGLLLGLSWQGPAANSAAESARQPERIALSIERLEAEQRELENTLAGLRQELLDRQQATAADTDRLEALRAELDRQRLLAGLTDVQGPGVAVILDDSRTVARPGTDPSVYLIHEQDLRDIVSLLWMAGSEAIALNDERLVSSSSVYCVGSTVLVNNTRLSPPYVIRAIGNSRVQQDYLRNPSYLQSLKEKRRLYNLQFRVEDAPQLALPAYRGSFLAQHARPGE